MLPGCRILRGTHTPIACLPRPPWAVVSWRQSVISVLTLGLPTLLIWLLRISLRGNRIESAVLKELTPPLYFSISRKERWYLETCWAHVDSSTGKVCLERYSFQLQAGFRGLKWEPWRWRHLGHIPGPWYLQFGVYLNTCGTFLICPDDPTPASPRMTMLFSWVKWNRPEGRASRVLGLSVVLLWPWTNQAPGNSPGWWEDQNRRFADEHLAKLRRLSKQETVWFLRSRLWPSSCLCPWLRVTSWRGRVLHRVNVVPRVTKAGRPRKGCLSYFCV